MPRAQTPVPTCGFCGSLLSLSPRQGSQEPRVHTGEALDQGAAAPRVGRVLSTASSGSTGPGLGQAAGSQACSALMQLCELGQVHLPVWALIPCITQKMLVLDDVLHRVGVTAEK